MLDADSNQSGQGFDRTKDRRWVGLWPKQGLLPIVGLLGILTGVVGSEDAQQAERNWSFEILRDVPFGTGGERILRMHILRPKNPPEGPLPVVVWVHGGAWRGGNKDGGIPLLTPLAERGYLGASIEYRLSQEATFPAQIEDCKAAIRYLRAHAEEYGLDPDRIGVWGSSAGGHLVALLGTTGDVAELEGAGGWPEHSSRVQAVCDWFGPTDFLKMNKGGSDLDHDAPDSPESQLIGGPIQDHPERSARANPITYLTPDDPPFLIMHGDQDRIVPPNQSELLHEALQNAGVSSTMRIIEGAGHGFRASEVMPTVMDFFDSTLKGRPETD